MLISLLEFVTLLSLFIFLKLRTQIKEIYLLFEEEISLSFIKMPQSHLPTNSLSSFQ